MSGASTAEAAAAILLCQDWADAVRTDVPCAVYLFGSAVYAQGDQFDPEHSDIDLIICLCEDGSPTWRAEAVRSIGSHKSRLEIELLTKLHRANCVEPAASVVVLTPYELKANVHKSGVRRFFSHNIFMDLCSSQTTVGLRNAGCASVSEETRQALECTQRTRNAFLAVAANDTGGLTPFDGHDPMPKALARAAAQLDRTAKPGEWYDTRRGLEIIFESLRVQQAGLPELEPVFTKLSKRRGGRGRNKVLTAWDQLLLTEVLFAEATREPLEPLTGWELRFDGPDLADDILDRLISGVQKLLPDSSSIEVYRR